MLDLPRPLASSAMFDLVTPLGCGSRRRGADGDRTVGIGKSWEEEMNFEWKV